MARYSIEGPGWQMGERWILESPHAWTPERLCAVLAEYAAMAPEAVLASWSALDWARWRESWLCALKSREKEEAVRAAL